MKKVLITVCVSFLLHSFGLAQNFNTTFDPITSYKNEGRGFYADFDFTVVGFEQGTNASNIRLNSMKINFEKGYYRKFFSQPAGKFYKCAQLNELCTDSKVDIFWIGISWEYNGKLYVSGGQFTGMQRGGIYDYTNVLNPFTPPSDIPFGARRQAVIKNISISSCSFNTTDKIEETIRAINKF